MNKNGFTFIELLAIIILIGVITLVAVPSIKLADKKIQQKNYNAKVELIEKAAENYGDDHKELLLYSTSTEKCTDSSSNIEYPCINITVKDLLNNGYISKDPGLKTEDVLDPRTDKSILNKTISLYVKNNQVYTILNF